MGFLDGVLRFLGLASRASEQDDRDAKAVGDARRAGRTAGEMAAQAEEEARARLARAQAGRCKLCGGTGFLRAHVDEEGAACPRCNGTGDDHDTGPRAGVGTAMLAFMVLPAFAGQAHGQVHQAPAPPPLYCKALLAASDPEDAHGLRQVLVCERLTSAYALGLDAVALRRAEETAAAIPSPPSRLTWLLLGAAAVAALWGGVEVYEEALDR